MTRQADRNAERQDRNGLGPEGMRAAVGAADAPTPCFTTPNPILEGVELREAYARVREALEKWKCPSCGGAKTYMQRTGQNPGTIIPCKVCEETGLHPTAREALKPTPLIGLKGVCDECAGKGAISDDGSALLGEYDADEKIEVECPVCCGTGKSPLIGLSQGEEISGQQGDYDGQFMPWHGPQPIEQHSRRFKGRDWVPLEAAIAALQFWQERDWLHEQARAALSGLSLPVSQGLPIPMVLYCPKCGVQHIDEAAPEELGEEGRPIHWTNPPHRSHLCHGCGCIWRPADVATNGVAAIETVGKADTWHGGVSLPGRDAETRARELLAEAYDAEGFPGVAVWLRTDPKLTNTQHGTAIRAIVAALSTVQDGSVREETIDRLRKALANLAVAEAAYRQAHDIYGDDKPQAGRAWDLMRRAGDKARNLLRAQSSDPALPQSGDKI